MRKSLFVSSVLITIGLASCQNKPIVSQENWIFHVLDIVSHQLKQTAKEIADSTLMPRSTYTEYELDFLVSQMEQDAKVFQDSLWFNPPTEKLGKRRLCNIYDWTSGFFPGSLWYAYELTGDEVLKTQAIKYTNMLNPIRHYKDNHDIGFMMNCSYGNALRLAPNDSIANVLIETADNLCTRFNEQIGCIRSWDFGHWNYPVIIDNMMNLDLLFNASKLTGNKKYYNVAVKHAKTTMKHHFRSDYTCYHVVSYNNDGTVENQGTHQGQSDNSAWSRGQAWAVYGYTACYRETRDITFLRHAVHVAEMIMKRVNTNDSIPYWDYDAPDSKITPRDASAASITASALIELSTFATDGLRYFKYAENILRNLSGKNYLAKKGKNQGFILMHSVGSLPHGSEIDTPLNYADYYYLEALKRYLDMQK